MSLESLAPPGQPADLNGNLPPNLPRQWESSVYWQQQQLLLRVSQENSIPHAYARCAAIASKNNGMALPTVADFALQLAKESLSSNAMNLPANVTGMGGGTASSGAGTSTSTSSGQGTATNASGSTSGAPVTPAKKTGKSFAEKRDQREEERQRHINEVIHHQYWTALDCSGQGLFTVSPKLRNYPFLQKLYLNHNNIASLPKCVTELNHLRVLDLSGNQITELPAEIRKMSSLRVLLLFDNQLEVLPYEVGCLFQLQMIGLLGNPWAARSIEEAEPATGKSAESSAETSAETSSDTETAKSNSEAHNSRFDPEKLRSYAIHTPQAAKERLAYLQLEAFTRGGTAALVEFLRDNAPVFRQPRPRELVHLNHVVDSQNELSLLTYNTLCDVYCTPQVYAYTPAWALKWWHRKQLLVEEVLHYNTDIVCLQEVNAASLTELWLPSMEPRGYKLLYYQKTRARTMSQQSEAKFVDGCATFYKQDKLHLVDKYPVEFNSKALLKDDLKKSEDIFNRVMTRDNIAIIGVFEVKATGRQVVVANTHLHWDPAFCDVKLVQTALLLEETENMARKYAKLNFGGDLKQVPVLIAGDFNSAADSGVVQLFNHSSVPPNHTDFEGHTYGNFTETGISHNLPLKSAYPEEVQLPFTNFTPDFVEVIDYIVYSTPTIKVNALLGKIDPEYVENSVAFPNAHFPSDHISIGGHFEFI